MTDKIHLSNLTPREAVADALNRAVHGIDINDQTLFASACVKDSSMLLVAGPVTLSGWDSINGYFQRVFALTTTHIVSNLRIELKDDNADTAHLTAHALAYHVRPDDALKREDTSYTSSCLYDMNLIKDGSDGLWKIQRWELKVQWTTGDFAVLHG